MRTTIDLTIASIKMLARDRTALLSAAIFPVLFLLVFSLYDLSISPVGDFAVGPRTDQLDYFDYVLPGMLALGLMNFTMVGVAGSVARFRETGVLRRLTASPVSPTSFIVGQILARLALALVQVALLLVFGLVLGGSVAGNPVWLFVLAALGNLTLLALGFAIAGRAPSVDAANNLAGLATMPMMFLSGMFFPVASLSVSMQLVAGVLPITPLVDAMRAVALDGAGLGDVHRQLAILAAWAPISVVLARLSFRFDDKPRTRSGRRRSRGSRGPRGSRGTAEAADRLTATGPR